MALYDSLFGLMDCQAAQVRTALPLSRATCGSRNWHATRGFEAACNLTEMLWQGAGCLTLCCVDCSI